jgi:uncharacterized membrane protein (DUF373 family)
MANCRRPPNGDLYANADLYARWGPACPMETRMNLFRAFNQSGGFYELYYRFELVVLGVLLSFISIIILYSIGILAATLFNDIISGIHFDEPGGLKDTVGMILSILILIEFNHSIVLAMRERAGVLQVRVIVMITIIVIARKLILIDYATVNWLTLLGFGGLALALGALYWLLSEIEERRRAAALPVIE